MESWGQDRDDKEIESMNEREVTSELEISGSELQKVQESLGFSPDEALDRFEEGCFESREYETQAGVRPDGDEMVLEGLRDISPEVLAHESVHGMMMQPDASNYLPGENQFEQTLYDEFVARMAEDELENLEVPDTALEDLRDARNDYMKVREKYEGEIFPEEFDSLYEDVMHTERTTDQKAQQELDDFQRPYQMLREQVLAAKAAQEYKQENNVEINEFIKPDRKLYEDTVDYIKQVEQDLIRG